MNVFTRIFELGGVTGEPGPFLALGLLLLFGFAGGWVAKRCQLPSVAGNILGGILIGPACLGLIGTPGQLVSLAPLSTFAMSLVAVTIGGHLSYRRIHNSLRRIILISLFEVAFSVFFVFFAAEIWGLSWPMAGFLGVLAASTAPATTLALIRETRSKGAFVKTLVSVVALNNIWCVLLFVMFRSIVAAYFRSGDALGSLDEAFVLLGYNLLGAVVLGFAAGWITRKLVARPEFHGFTTVFLAIMLCDGFAAYAHLSPLLVNLFFGVYLGNSSEAAERQLKALVPLEPILYVCFFTLAGASLHLDSMLTVGWLALVYLLARAVGKSLGAVFGGFVGRCSPRIWSNMSFALYPQSGIAIGLVVLLGNDACVPAEMSQSIAAVILAGVAMAEIAGPFCVKAALKRSGEEGLDRRRLVDFLSEEFIIVGLKALDKWDAIRQLVDFLMRTHRVEHVSRGKLYQSIIDREEEMTTGLGMGIAIPHGRIDKGPFIQGVMGICSEGVDFGAPDGEPVRLIMLIATPEDQNELHLSVLASLSSMVSNSVIRTRLLAAISPEDAMEIIESEEARDYNYFLEESTE